MNTYRGQVNIASYGTWDSPITPEKVAEGTPSIIYMLVEGDESYLCELRPKNKGRYTIVRCDQQGKRQDVTPPDFNVRSAVHEYGGAPFTVAHGTIYASNGANHALYALSPGKEPEQLTEGQVRVEATNHWKGVRFADLQATAHGLIAIGEAHAPGKQPDNFLAYIDLATKKVITLASGYDFYSSPTLSPDGTKIAWLCWNHPNMPWTHTQLWTANFFEKNPLRDLKQIAGDSPEAILQPQWSPDGDLYFISDRDHGWWNIHRLHEGALENLCPMEAEVGDPPWVFGRSSYAFLVHQNGTEIIFAFNHEGEFNLGVIDLKTKAWHKIPRNSANIQHVRQGPECVRFLESYADKEPALIQIQHQPQPVEESVQDMLEEGKENEQDNQASAPRPAAKRKRGHFQLADYPLKTLYALPNQVGPEYISKPAHYAFPSNGRTVYGFFYPPYNKYYKGPSGERPPLIVMIHGGPTSQAKAEFSLAKQFWTSRGFALFDINYAGSTGYGRLYRQLLAGKWGVYDVEDCIEGALWLVNQGLVDGHRLFIRGGSAGGFTTLAVLTASGAFRAAASYYGVADIIALAADTHKFESHYMDQLVGKYPEEKQVWEARSPIHSVGNINTPLIIFQGEKDAVVPKSQSILIYEALKKRNIPVELHLYPEEEHGFRQAANIIHSLTQEVAFYQKLCR